MTDIVLDTITSGYNLSKINKNFEKVEDVINDDVLHRRGGNNVMQQDLDLNGHALLNVATDVSQPGSFLTVGDADARYVNISGDSMAGPLNINGQVLTGLRAPLTDTEAVRRLELNLEEAARISADANIQAQLTGNIPLEASAFSEVSWHNQTIANSVVVPAGKNAWSFGPQMTIAQGQEVVVSEGSSWTIADGDEYEGPLDEATYVKRVDYDADKTSFASKAELIASNGSSLISYKNPSSNSVARSVQEKLNSLEVSVEDFGAVGDGVADDTVAFQRAITYVRQSGGGTVRFRKKHLIDQNLYVEDYVSLHGGIDNPDELLDGQRVYGSKGSQLIINPTASVYIQSGASVARCLVMRKGLVLPFTNATAAAAGVAAFTGTAFTGNGAGVSLHNLLVLGFGWVYKSTNLERAHIYKVYGDCTNGIEIAACYDIADITENEMWPYTTTHQSWTTGALNKRTGTAFRFANVGDWNRFNRCFSYGYNKGFEVDSCDNVVLINCGTDHVGPDTNTTSIGFNFIGTSKNPVMIGCQSAAQYRGVVMNSTAANGNVLQMSGCQFWDNDDLALKVVNGYVLASGCVFRGGTVAADIDNTSLGTHFANCRFDGQTTRPVGGSGLNKVSAKGNTYVNTVDDSLGERELSDNQFNNVVRSIFTASTAGTNRLDRKAQGSANSPTALTDGSVVSAWSISGYKGDNYSVIAQLRGQVQGTVSTTTMGGGWIVSTAANSGVSTVDRWGFMQNGNLQPIADNTVSLGASGARVSSIWSANGTIQTSDRRTKLDIKDCTLGLDFVNILRPVSYRWKEGRQEVVRQVWVDGETGEEVPEGTEGAVPGKVETKSVEGERTHWGLIAQEVKEATDAAGVDFAGWVLSDKNDPDSQQALRYDQFISPLIKAVQELSKQLEELKAKVK